MGIEVLFYVPNLIGKVYFVNMTVTYEKHVLSFFRTQNNCLIQGLMHLIIYLDLKDLHV